MSLNPAEIYGQIVKTGDDWADKDAAATILEETKKTVLAELMNQLEGSIAAREAQALADPVYRWHVTNMVNARREAHKAKVRFDGAKLLADLRRTEAATQRAEMRGA